MRWFFQLFEGKIFFHLIFKKHFSNRITVWWSLSKMSPSHCIAKSYSCRLDSSKLIMTDQTMFSAILGHSKSFIFVSSHPKSTWVTKTSYVGGPSIQYQIYCDSVVTTTILCTLTFNFLLKKLKKVEKIGYHLRFFGRKSWV